MAATRRNFLQLLKLAALAAALAACGPSFALPNAPGIPCPRISATEYETAIAAGAARATANVGEGGIVSMETGPGIVHCATYRSTLKPCRRPVDFVIRYTLASGEVFHVRVPAGDQYRFNIQRLPNTCEIVNR